MAFLDAEFNDGEVCSVGIVIMSPDNKELTNMYSIIKPIEHDFMPSRLRKLTGLDFNVLVNEGQDFHKVCHDINNLVRQYKVKNIYTWGSDDKNVFELGLYPFILGDIIKITLLISILPNIWKFIKNEEMK